MIFEPQPQEYFYKVNAPIRLTGLKDKIKYLSTTNIDAVLCVDFDKWFAKLNAFEFINELLVKKLNISLICIGDDFRFGIHRQGNFSFLQKIGNNLGFEVINIVTCTEFGKRISSTSIRNALIQDRLTEAEQLLGHSYCISGKIIYKKSIEKTIEFFTVNISLNEIKIPINGIYAVEIHGIVDSPLPGMANISIKSKTNNFLKKFEIYFLDKITKNLYGYNVEIAIRSKIRNEQQFNSFENIKWQIKTDIKNVKKYFKNF